ncbi:carboxylesterase/lipase family protein [Nitrospirillum amazonense]|uniref:carboxylesterase/lipase family protein n=1 Tax=Nitrospirillum amazonense TaxID=28077 RepID=UPI002412DC01|nr:carboxylesterase family protein [Nitrospirillum amazonense]MDG3439048.1 carboxylesterase family protein [Nitrospirillum amazonense]
MMRPLLRMGVCAAVLLLAHIGAAGAAPGAPVVNAPVGSVEGQVMGDLAAFKGIPYAQPPVGPLRWKPPVPVQSWTGVRPAHDFGAACVQPPPRPGSLYADPPAKMGEDCLSLNVWAPKAAKKAPVLVWIHGGALVGGASSEGLYDGARLAEHGVVVVSINYRLGVLGYLAHPDLSAESPDGVSGNYGLLDQIEALRWVQRNIGAFGGDPANVTIAGESAGALSVMYLMASPPARGLFTKAIAQSAYMISTPTLKEARYGEQSAEENGRRLAAAVGAADVAALRGMDAEALTVAAVKAGYGPWGNIDGHVLTGQLVDVFDQGRQAPVPLLVGFNSGEIRSLRFLAPPPPTDAATYETTIRHQYGDLADAYLALYPTRDMGESILANTRDALYAWTSERLAIKQTALGQPAFLYLFDHGYPEADAKGLHGFHASEIPYVFGTAHGTPPYWPKVADTPAEARFSDAMMDYWTSFARTGTPSAAGQPAWQPYDGAAAYMHFAAAPQPETHLMPGMYALHEATVCRRHAAGTLPWNWNTGIMSPALPAKTAGCP